MRVWVAESSAWLQEESPSLCAEQEGDQEFSYLFCMALTHPFCSEGGVCLPSPLECKPGSLVSAKLQGEPLSLYGEVHQGFPLAFLYDPRASFSFGRRGGISQATLGGYER